MALSFLRRLTQPSSRSRDSGSSLPQLNPWALPALPNGYQYPAPDYAGSGTWNAHWAQPYVRSAVVPQSLFHARNEDYIQFAKTQLAEFDPEIVAIERAPFKTLGPMAERIRMGYFKAYPHIKARPFHMPLPPLRDDVFQLASAEAPHSRPEEDQGVSGNDRDGSDAESQLSDRDEDFEGPWRYSPLDYQPNPLLLSPLTKPLSPPPPLGSLGILPPPSPAESQLSDRDEDFGGPWRNSPLDYQPNPLLLSPLTKPLPSPPPVRSLGIVSPPSPPPLPRESFTAPIPLTLTFSTRIICTPDHYKARATTASSSNEQGAGGDSTSADSDPTEATPTASESDSKGEVSDIDDKAGTGSRGVYRADEHDSTLTRSQNTTSPPTDTNPEISGFARGGQESPLSPSPTVADVDIPAEPPLAQPASSSDNVNPPPPHHFPGPLSPLVVDGEADWTIERGLPRSLDIIDHGALESPVGRVVPLSRPSGLAVGKSNLRGPGHRKEAMLKSVLIKSTELEKGEAPIFYPTPSTGPSTSITGRLEATSNFTSTSQSTSVSRRTGALTTVHSTTSSATTVLATTYHTSPTFSSSSYDADLDSASSQWSTSPRFEDFFSPNLDDGMSPPLMGILRDFENSPGLATTLMSSPSRPTQSTIPTSFRPSFNAQAPTRHIDTEAARPVATEEASLPPAEPNPTEMIAGIVRSISRSTTELVSAVINPEDGPSPSSTSTTGGPGIRSNGMPSNMSPTSEAPPHPPSSSSALASAVVPSAAERGSDVIVSSESHSRTSSSMSLFSNASQFGMRDPNFHVASRDVQVVNVYNITLNQLQATTTSTATGGAES